MDIARTFALTLSLTIVGTAYAAEAPVGGAPPAQPAAAPAPAKAQPTVIAVLSCEAGSFDLLDIAKAMPELISTDLSRDEGIDLVERTRLDKVLNEQELGASGLVDPEQAAKIGKLIGARLLVTMRAYAVGDQLYLTTKLINVESGRVRSATKNAPRKTTTPALLASMLAQDLRRLIATDISNGAVSDDDKLKALLADLAKQLGDKPRPKVTVVVPEETLKLAIPDPAVKTELCYMLRRLKFRVIENDSPVLDEWVKEYSKGKSGKFPAEVGDVDVVIYGQAFSENVGQTGNLVSARARVELNAIDVHTSELLATAAATASGADLSQGVAGKAALAAAGQKAAKDFLPELLKSWIPPAAK